MGSGTNLSFLLERSWHVRNVPAAGGGGNVPGHFGLPQESITLKQKGQRTTRAEAPLPLRLTAVAEGIEAY